MLYFMFYNQIYTHIYIYTTNEYLYIMLTYHTYNSSVFYCTIYSSMQTTRMATKVLFWYRCNRYFIMKLLTNMTRHFPTFVNLPISDLNEVKGQITFPPIYYCHHKLCNYCSDFADHGRIYLSSKAVNIFT